MEVLQTWIGLQEVALTHPVHSIDQLKEYEVNVGGLISYQKVALVIWSFHESGDAAHVFHQDCSKLRLVLIWIVAELGSFVVEQVE